MTSASSPRILVSLVSHQQQELAQDFLVDLAACGQPGLRVVYTVNVPEPEPPAVQGLGAAAAILRNVRPKGFAANHNAAFASERSEYFCVANPDIRLRE